MMRKYHVRFGKGLVWIGVWATSLWGIATILKIPFLSIFFYLGGSSGVYLNIMSVCCVVCLAAVSVLFWIFTYSWEHYFCHVALTSSAVFFLMSCCRLTVENLAGMFLIYVVWCSVSIFFVSSVNMSAFFNSSFVYFAIGLLVAYPLSFNVLYKFFIALHVYSCGWWFLFIWGVCGVSEQIFLLKFLLSGASFKDWGGGLLV